MQKMIFIEPKAPNFHIFSQFQIPRLGSFILGALMKQRGWDVEIFVEETDAINYEQLATADIVSISTITSTAPRAYAIADKVRSMGIPVIMGGPHVTFLPDEALNHADFIIRGEGEKALTLLLNKWEQGLMVMNNTKQRHPVNSNFLVELNLASHIALSVKSTINILRFYTRLPQLKAATKIRRATINTLKAILKNEIEIARQDIPLITMDSRLGYHPEAHCRHFNCGDLEYKIKYIKQSIKKLDLIK